jgi:hypothetical protein
LDSQQTVTNALQHAPQPQKAEKHEQRENATPKSPRRDGKIRKNNGGTPPLKICFSRPEKLPKNDTTKKIRLNGNALWRL